MEEFRFKKKFGQNFLSDENLLDAIVRDAGVDEETAVLEIGAGAGALTRALAKRAKRVVAFEIDPELKPYLLAATEGCKNVEILFADFMKADLPALEKRMGEYRVVANLPYYITTPAVMRFVEEAESCLGFTVTVQEEVARRFCASAGTSEYGAVTAALQRRAVCRLVRRVPRTMFRPTPNVDSAVVRADFTDPVPVKDPAAYRAAVRCAFLNRRKTLENNLVACFHLTREEAKSVMRTADIGEGVRGETLDPVSFARLADALLSHGVLRSR